MLMQNFGMTNKEHYGMLWYFLEWSIKTFIENVCISIAFLDSLRMDKTNINALVQSIEFSLHLKALRFLFMVGFFLLLNMGSFFNFLQNAFEV